MSSDTRGFVIFDIPPESVEAIISRIVSLFDGGADTDPFRVCDPRTVTMVISFAPLSLQLLRLLLSVGPALRMRSKPL